MWKKNETQAIMRASTIETVFEVAVLIFLGIGLISGAVAISEFLAHKYPVVSSETLTYFFCVAFIAALAFVIWSFARKTHSWTDDLKNVVPLERFLKFKPAGNTVLAPNLSDEERQTLLRNLQTIHDRDDVLEIIVGLLPDEGNISDRILIKTYAPRNAARSWSELLDTEFNEIASYTYQVKGTRRKVRSLLFVWD